MAQKPLLLKELSRYPVGTFADIIYRDALLHADREAFVYGGERVTFAEYNGRVNALIHTLNDMGVKKGDAIGIFSWNCLDYACVVGAAMKGGFIVSPFNPRLPAKDLEYLINAAETAALFVGIEHVAAVEPLRPRLPGVRNYIVLEGAAPGMTSCCDLLDSSPRHEPEVDIKEDDPFLILYTSGTTGAPRGALYNHRLEIENAQTRIIAAPIDTSSKHVLALPLFHIAGMESLQIFLYAGGTNIILKSFDPAAVLKAVQEERATDLEMVPTNLAAIFALPDFDKYDLSSLKRIFYAASPMPQALLKRGLEKWGPIFSQLYGQTESGPIICNLPPARHRLEDASPEEQKLLVSVGQPCIGVHVRIVDSEGNDLKPGEIGEIIVQSHHIMTEYWQKPEETAEAFGDGWLHTRDLGYYNEQGFIFIADRKQDMIISGGEHIYPREVEEVLYQHPAIREAAVIGVPDPYWAERVHAVVALKTGCNASGDELIDFCKQRIARYKAPKSVEFIEALPKNAAGKIVKTELRKKYKEQP